MKKLKCVWCYKDTEIIPCQNCGRTNTVCDPYVEHQPYWSRYTIHLVECSICGRTTTYDKQTNHPCPPKSYEEYKKKEKFNYELIRNAEQFLTDLNNAKKYKDEMREIDARYYETPEWFQNTYNQAMQDLGRWLVRDYQEEDEYMDALESTGDTDF